MAMPKASVDEYGDLKSANDDIGLAGQRRDVQPVANESLG